MHLQPNCSKPTTIVGAKPEKDASAPTVLVGRLEDAKVGGACDPPRWILHIVALAVDRPVLVREAEGGLDVGAHVREHRVLDGDALHLATHLAGVEGEPEKSEVIAFLYFNSFSIWHSLVCKTLGDLLYEESSQGDVSCRFLWQDSLLS